MRYRFETDCRIRMLSCVMGGLMLTGCTVEDIPTGEHASEILTTPTVTTIPPTQTTTAETTTTAWQETLFSEMTEVWAEYPALTAKIADMSIEEKAAQMLLVSCHTVTPEEAAQGGAGGVCLYTDAFEKKTKAEVCAMTAEYQSRSKIPMLIAVDEEGGGVTRVSGNPNLRDTRFLRPGKLYELGGWERIEADTAEKSELLRSLGINVNLAPVADVPQSRSDYIYWRCFSDDAKETAEYTRRVVAVMEENGIGSTLKHFPGYGGSTDTHKGMGYDGREYTAFTESDFLPFLSGIAAGADSVMVSHNIVSCMDAENPASLSPAVHRILREEIGFSGVVITDDLDMNAIRDFCGTEEAAVLAVEAGNDLICTPSFSAAKSAIAEAIRSGRIPETSVNDSILRILIWKENLSLIK